MSTKKKTNALGQIAGMMATFWLALSKALESVDPEGWMEKFHELTRSDDKKVQRKIEQIANVILDRSASDNQIAILEYLIHRSKDMKPLAKKVAIWLLRESKGLMRNVYTSFSEEEGSKEILASFHDMLSGSGSTHLNEVCMLVEPRLTFSEHYGMTRTAGEKIPGCRVWLSLNGHYDHEAEFVPHEMETIQAIEPSEIDYSGRNNPLL
jgi:hypothetical protein